MVYGITWVDMVWYVVWPGGNDMVYSKVLFTYGEATHKSTVARTVMCRQDGRGRFPVLLDDHSKCRTNSQRKSQLS